MAMNLERNRVAMENDGNRVDALAKVTGAAKYTFDIKLPNMTYAQHIRAPYADSKLTGAELEAARALPGVLEIVLYKQDRGAKGVEQTTDLFEEVRRGAYGGEVIGHVCAESMHLVEDAISAAKLTFEHGTPKTSLQREAGAMPEPEAADAAVLAEIYGKAAHTIEATYETQIQHHVSLETHGAVVHKTGDKALVYASTQGVGMFRDGLDAELGLAKKDIEVSCQYIGGGFGSKFGAGVEGKLAAKMAAKFDRPCRMMNTRKNECLDTGMRPGSLQYYKLAADAAGKVIGGRWAAFSSVGAAGKGGGINNCEYDLGGKGAFFPSKPVEIALSHTPARPQRAPGWPQGAFALESALDELAAKVGLDPIEFRKINDPRKSRHNMYEEAKGIIGWDRRKPDGQWPGVVKHGFGCGAAQWENKTAFPTGAEVKVFRDGKIEVRCGIQEIGVGNLTMLVDLCAHGMGVSRDHITGFIGNTNYPAGAASGGSAVARSTAPAVWSACELAKIEVLKLAAAELKLDAAALDVKGNNIVTAADGAAKMTWPDACKLIVGENLTLTASKGDPKFKGEGDSDGTCLAEVAVDTETGIVRVIKLVVSQQCGFPVNRKTAESQILGGAIQGLSFALFEDRIINAENGAMVNPNMEWYKIAGPLDMPEIIPILDVPPGTTGVRSLGEPPIIGVPAAIANAVANATGARVRSLPITPAKVLAALKDKGGVAS